MLEHQCQLCGNTNFSEGSSFCRSCGTPIHNICTSEECSKLNEPDAAFCEYCGSKTIYNELNAVQVIESPF